MSEEMKMQESVQSEMTLEEGFLQIEDIIKKMEDAEVTLDESFLLYQKGIESLKNCNQILDAVEKKMQILNSDGELSDF